MDSSCSDMDVSLSPTQILERLRVIRQLQLFQRGKLQKQQLQYSVSPVDSSEVTEIVSQFSNSTSYNTFKSLLSISKEKCFENGDNEQVSSRLQDRDLIDGITVLNLSQESEFLINSPISNSSRSLTVPEKCLLNESVKNKIKLDEMPIIAPKKDFQNLLLEKLKSEQVNTNKTEEIVNNDKTNVNKSKPYLKRGEGMSRFGLKRNDLIIQSTNSLPWKKSNLKPVSAPKLKKSSTKANKNVKIKEIRKETNEDAIQITVPVEVHKVPATKSKTIPEIKAQEKEKINTLLETIENKIDIPNIIYNPNKPSKHPLQLHKGKTWAAILTKEQDDFLKQLKQSEYYKNFASPAKSTISDISCDDTVSASLEREEAEQNLFELLEKKVKNGSFCLENSFFNKLLKKDQLECSGESTPLVLQKCLSTNPNLLHIYPPPRAEQYESQSEIECGHTDCHDTSSTTSSSTCSCKTVEETQEAADNTLVESVKEKEVEIIKNNVINSSDTDLNSNMVEMNAKLVATSDLLKDRLRELEDEIETFRKENVNLTKMREEMDLERQKFYEEKSTFEQKYNEEKILAEYYLAEEKDKLSKQKATYDRYVREMRGRLNKKDKEEVVLLKKEINDLKEEIRLKDAKTTTTIARLRNQIKIMDKEKKELEEECEKLRKENGRIRHTNETTRRLTNIKCLEEINRKLSTMSSRETKSEVFVDDDVKYKSYEMERQCRSKQVKKLEARRRTKSVPNLNITSRYAKYFSQRDAASEIERHCNVNVEKANSPELGSDKNELRLNLDYSNDSNDNLSENEDEKEQNNLERIYSERFSNESPDSASIRFNNRNSDSFFLRKSTSNSTLDKDTSKSPVSILSNRSSSKRSPIETTPNNVSETNLNPIENKRSDGSKELKFMNGNTKYISADGTYSKFTYYNGDVKETFYNEGRIKYYYAENKTYHTTHSDGLEVLEFADGQIEKRYKDGSSEVRLPNGSVRYSDPKNPHVREEWRFTDGTVLTVTSNGEQFVRFPNGQVEVHAQDHKRREFPDGTVKLVYKDGTSETRYSSGRIRIKDKKGQLIMDSNPGS